MAQRRLRILCFGDSLTSGYSCFGYISHPYNVKLTDKLEEAFPDIKVEITEDGVPGGLTGLFTSRIMKHFGRERGRQPFDWTIILGGTNDIGHGIEGSSIIENLQKTWNVPLQNRSKVLALTIPEAGLKNTSMRQRLADRRDPINNMIKGYDRPNFYSFDHHDAVPFFAMTDEERERYWDDNVHLTPDGYDLMGEKIAEALIEMFKADPSLLPQVPSEASKPSRGKRAFRDDDSVFIEEEDSRKGRIDKGYVVVRRKDLD